MYCGVPGMAGSPPVPLSGDPIQHLRDSEVGDLHATVLIDKQILRLDVAMHDAVLMRVLQRLADRRHDRQGLLRRKPAELHRLAQIHSVHEFHDQEIQPVAFSKLMHGDNIRMVQRGERLRLLHESLLERRVGDALRGEELQRDETIESFLPRLVNHAHSAAAEALENFKLRKVRRQFRRGQRCRSACPSLGRRTRCRSTNSEMRHSASTSPSGACTAMGEWH